MEKKKEKKQVSLAVVIILGIVIVVALGYACKMIKDNKSNEEPKVEEKENKEVNDVPVEDKYAAFLYTGSNGSGLYVNYNFYILDKGKLYYKVIDTTVDEKDDLAEFNFGTYNGYENARKDEIKNLTLFKGLNNIKRIKGTNSHSNGVSLNVLLITEDGKIYTYYAGDEEAIQDEILSKYNIDDVLEYNMVPGCICDEEMEKNNQCVSCGGTFKIKTKEGRIISGTVSLDGSIVEK